MKLCSTAAVRGALMACGLAVTLWGCAAEQPQSSVSRGLVSGVTSSNGGGMAPANFSTFGSTPPSGPTFDTGNMAYPAPLPQGNLGVTRVR
jgi:hypothetical protein